MPSNAAGSLAYSKARKSLAVFAVPIMLTACVSGEGGMTGIAEVGSPVEMAGVPVPGERPAESASGETPVEATALAPVRRENGTISGSSAIDRLIEQEAEKNGLPRELAFAVVHVESRYNPKAIGRGVYGLSQIKPATARSLGFSGSVEDLMEPATNLRYGMKYLRGAWEKGGRDVCQASMKYKGGHRATTMTQSAQTYCRNVKRHMASITGEPATAATQVAALPGVGEASAVAAIAPRARPSSPAAAAIEESRVAAAVEAAAETTPVEVVEQSEAVAEVAAPAAVLAKPAEAGDGGSEQHAVATITAASSFAEPDSARFGD